MDVGQRTAYQLVLLGAGPHAGERVGLDRAVTTVGRAAGCDLRLDDPAVSAHHAQLLRGPAGVVVDLGSTNGTTVGGRPVSGEQPLRDGDVVAFGGVPLRLEVVGAPGPVRYEVGEQRAGSISNVAGNQTVRYEQYVHTVQAQKADFLREVAATRTRARWLVWVGLVLTVLGSGVFLEFVLGFLSGIWGSFDEPMEAVPDLQVREVAGVPTFVYGAVVASVGSVLLMVGVVLHVVATARTRRVERDLTVLPPWQTPYA